MVAIPWLIFGFSFAVALTAILLMYLLRNQEGRER